MIPTYGKDPYALKKCLTGDALRVVHGVDDEFDQMMLRLEDRFGRPKKLVDEILCELRRLKPIPEDDYGKFIELVRTVEDCWLNMVRVNLSDEMSSIAIISQIEKLLPPIQLREWAKLKLQPKITIGKKGHFSQLLDFLLQEKRTPEYIRENVRKRTDHFSKGRVNNFELAEKEDDIEDNFAKMEKLVLTQQNHNAEILNKVVEGFSQIVQALGRPSDFGSQTNRRKCWYHNSDNHTITDCATFKSMDVAGRLRLIREKCFCCLSTGHMSRSCRNKVFCDVADANNQICGKPHHRLLHRYDIVNMNSNSNLREEPSDALLMISTAKCFGQQLITLWDSGANISLIRKGRAHQLGLVGKRVTLKISKSGNVTEIGPSKEYNLPLTDKDNRVWNIIAYEMNEITADVNTDNATELHMLFKGVSADEIRRPSGRVDLLIGTDCCVLLPTKIDQVGNLQLMKNQFGYCIRGSHPLSRGVAETYHCNLIHLSKTSVTRGDASDLIKQRNLSEIIEDFFTIERIGTHSPAK